MTSGLAIGFAVHIAIGVGSRVQGRTSTLIVSDGSASIPWISGHPLCSKNSVLHERGA
jgi:hypothetical protein